MAEEVKVEETAAPAKEAGKKAEKKAKSDKPGFFAKIGKFFKGLKSEMKNIVWFGKKQTVKSTGLVIVCLVIVSAVVSLIDLGFSNLIMWLGKLV